MINVIIIRGIKRLVIILPVVILATITMMITDCHRASEGKEPLFAIHLGQGVCLSIYYGLGYTIYKYIPSDLNGYQNGYEFIFGWKNGNTGDGS